MFVGEESLIELEKNSKKVNSKKFIAYIRSKIVDEDTDYFLLDKVKMLQCFELVLNG